MKETARELNHNLESLSDKLHNTTKAASRWLNEINRHQRRHNLDGRKQIILRYLVTRYLKTQIGTKADPGILRSYLEQRLNKEAIALCHKLEEFIVGGESQEGRHTGGLIDTLGRLTSDLESLQEEFKTGFSYFSRKENLPHSLVLYDPTQLDERYYKAYVPNIDTLRTISDKILNQRLERTVSSLSKEISAGRTRQWKKALLSETRKIFEPIKRDFHVLKVLNTDLDDQARSNHIRQMINRSAFWATRSGLHGTPRLPEEQIHYMIGLPAPAAGSSPEEASEINNFAERFKNFITNEVQSEFRYYPIPDTSEIIIYQEAGGFPINYLSRIVDLRHSYLKLYTAGEALHITCHDKIFRDLTILTKEERQALEEAHRCYVLGCLFDILEYNGGEYHWMERDGFQVRPHPLGNKHILLLKLTQNATLREKLTIKIRQHLDSIHASTQPDLVAKFIALLNHYERNAYGNRWGAVNDPQELDFDSMMEVLIVKDQLKQLEETPLVRKKGIEAVSELTERFAQNLESFAKLRKDGRYALILDE